MNVCMILAQLYFASHNWLGKAIPWRLAGIFQKTNTEIHEKRPVIASFMKNT